jgi:hypothetical protein
MINKLVKHYSDYSGCYDCISDEEAQSIFELEYKVNSDIGKIEQAKSYKEDISTLLKILNKVLKLHKYEYYESNVNDAVGRVG